MAGRILAKNEVFSNVLKMLAVPAFNRKDPVLEM